MFPATPLLPSLNLDVVGDQPAYIQKYKTIVALDLVCFYFQTEDVHTQSLHGLLSVLLPRLGVSAPRLYHGNFWDCCHAPQLAPRLCGCRPDGFPFHGTSACKQSVCAYVSFIIHSFH